MSFQNLLKKERDFFNRQFFGPVFKNGKIVVKIDGVLVSFKILPSDFTGWGVFRVIGPNVAELSGEANRQQISTYLGSFARTDVIICDQGDVSRGLIAHNDVRFPVSALVPVYLSSEVRLFDTASVRYDGQSFIFERIDNSRRRFAESLRNSLTSDILPAKIDISGLSKEERNAYHLVHKIREEAFKETEEGRIKRAIESGNAIFRSYLKRGSDFVVTVEVDGQTYSPVVREDLSVVSAGICLSGGDTRQDLQSLMHIYREGQNRGRVVRGDFREYYG